MAKKTTKKLISMLLSVVMIASSIPFAGIVALADTASDVAALQQTINNYTNMMDGSFYTNMVAAYQAYVSANEVLDIYEATAYDTGIADAKTKLENAMANMKPFTSKQGTVTGRMANDDSFVTQDHYNQIYKNILYSPECTTHAAQTAQTEYGRGTWNVGRAGCTWFANYATTVMLYDGKTTPQTAVMATAGAYSGGTWNYNNVRDTAARIDTSTSQGLTLPGDWHGLDTRDRNFMYVYFKDGQEQLPLSPTGSQYYSHNGRQTIAYANTMQFTGSFANGTYSKVVYPTFIYEGRLDTAGSEKVMTATSTTTPVYIINYKALVDAANANKAKITLKASSKNYKHGGLMQIFRAYETAIAVDPTSYNYSDTANAVNNCAAAIKNATEGLNNATVTEDGAGYDNLKKALQDTRNDYNAGITDPDIESAYADGVWAAFKTSYENAGKVFENLKTSGYDNDANAQQLADDLKYNKSQLVAVDRVDASALEIAIENGLAVINAESYFTADSFAAANAAALVEAAQIALWGSVDNYGVSAKLPADSEEAQAKVKAQADAIRAGLMKLKIDKNAVVISSGQSYNSAKALAEQYLAHADDYSNSSKLQEALDAAGAYADDDTLYLDASIEGHAHFVIETYASGVNGIMFAIQTLTPSFSKITDGTFAQLGTKETVTIDSEMYPDYWKLDFSRYNGSIIFKTDHLEKNYDLPDAQFAFKTNRNFTALLDSININADADLPNKEITTISSSQAFTDNATGWALNGDQCKTYTGLLGMSNGGIELSFHDIHAVGFTGTVDQIGYTKPTEEGNGNTRRTVGQDEMSTYDWTDDLTTTEGTEPISGGVTAKSSSNSTFGSTTLNAKMTIKTKATQSKLFDTDRATGDVTGLAGSIKLLKFDTSNSSSYIGMTYQWAHHPFNYWHGYSYDRAQYVQQIYVVDISSLLDLISYCEALDPTLYSNNSWAALSDALIAAKDEMPYAGMTADEIYEACDLRLQNLFNAFMNLQDPANNAKIMEALDLTTETYRNDETKCEPTTWKAFSDAYKALYQDFMGKYSAKNVRDYGVDEQDIIDAAAQPLLDAYNNLVRYADFSTIKNAITLMASSVETKKYTASQLDALKESVNNYSSSEWFTFYLANKDAIDAYLDGRKTPSEAILAKLHTFYDSKNESFADSQADILNVSNGIYSLVDDLPADPALDTSVLEAAVEKVYESYQDPDAYAGINEAVAAIRDMNLYTDYNLFGVTKQVFAYEDEEDVDAAVTEILSGEHAITAQKYTVSLTANGVKTDLGSFEYGTKVYVGSNGEISKEAGDYSSCDKVDWYSSYKSNTAKNNEKFVAADKYLAFVVKGNTSLRIEKAADYSNKVRINYVNGLNGKSYKIEYVDAGSTVTPNEHPDPYGYSFVGYTVKKEAVDSFTADADTTVTANFEYASTSDTYKVTIANYSTTMAVGPVMDIAGLKYNDLLTIAATDVNGTGNVAYAINGEVTETAAKKRTATTNNTVNYWAEVDADYVDAWMNYIDQSSADKKTSITAIMTAEKKLDVSTVAGSLRIVAVGADLNYRVNKDAFLLPLSLTDYNQIMNSNIDIIVGRDNAGATAYAGEVIKEASSISIIGNYAIPAGATMVESGVLFLSNGNATATTAELKFSNVGRVQAGDAKAVARMKSTKHTAGNQFVISIGTSKLSGEVHMRYAAYVIYEKDGVQYSYVQQPEVATIVNF